MPIEVPEEMIVILACSRVSIPFLDVEGEQCLVDMLFRLLLDSVQMIPEVFDKMLV
jgi:hypothetical protein